MPRVKRSCKGEMYEAETSRGGRCSDLQAVDGSPSASTAVQTAQRIHSSAKSRAPAGRAAV